MLSRSRLRLLLGFAFALMSLVAQAAYWSRAIEVARHATIWNNNPYWTSGGPGSFFPWPKGPGMLAVMTPMSSVVDQVIFTLIRSSFYVALVLGTTAAFAFMGYFLAGALRR